MSRLEAIITFIRLNKKVDLLFIVVLFTLVNGFLYSIHGVMVVNDSQRYVDYASGLSDGFYVDKFNIWYIGYSVYILLLKVFGGGLYGVIIGQYILSLIAVLTLYFTSILLWMNRIVALFSAFLFLLFIDIAVWNSYILTESLYTSCICISLYCYARLFKQASGFWFVCLTVLITLFTFMIKPTGIALFGALLAVLIYHVFMRIENKYISIGLVVLVTCCFLFLVDYMLVNYMIMENYKLGEVIYAVTSAKEKYKIDYLLLDVPTGLYQPSSDYSPIAKIILFIVHHPVYWFKLFLHKIFFLFMHIRPYWSSFHNVFSLLILVPVYYFFVKGIAGDVRKRLLSSAFAIVYLLLHTLSIGLTSNDWDGRFLIPMLPVIFLYAGKGVGEIILPRMRQMLIQKSKPVVVVAITVMLVGLPSCNNQEKLTSPGICISFDDRSIEEWNTLRPLFNKYQAKVTFFVTQFDSLTLKEIEYLHGFEKDGHEIGSHGARHVLAEYFLNEHTMEEYLNTEIYPSIERMKQHEFKVTSFAYPYGSMTWFTRWKLKDLFAIQRSDVAVNKERDLATMDNIFYDGSGVTYSLGIDYRYKLTTDMVESAIKRAVANGEVLMLHGHRPSNEGEGYSFNVSFLEDVLSLAVKHKLKFYTYNQLGNSD